MKLGAHSERKETDHYAVELIRLTGPDNIAKHLNEWWEQGWQLGKLFEIKSGMLVVLEQRH